VRTSALSALREELLKDYSELQGDMTRPVLLLLSLDRGADFVSLTVTDVVLLKPHLGVRAELYPNPKLMLRYKALF
jgi:hypothetical protein